MSYSPTLRREVETFLYYGYVPRLPADAASRPWALPADPGARLPDDEERCIELGLEALRAVFQGIGDGLQVVPLSGGLDSRLILGMLVAAGAGQRVVAVTFGTPGTQDFEQAQKVARRAGVRHETLDLTQAQPDEAALRRAVVPGENWTHVLEAHYNGLIPERFGHDAVYWSGIMANSINGSRYRADDVDWPSVRRRFALSNRHARSFDLCAPGFDPVQVLPAEPPLPGSRLTLFEQLYLGVRYPCRYDHCLLRPGFTYRTPFREPPWVNFSLNLPARLRQRQYLFRQVALRAQPELMGLPTKSRHGVSLTAPAWRAHLAHNRLRAGRLARRWLVRWPWRANPGANYEDFDLALRRPGRLRDVLQRSLTDLGARGLVDWVDLEALWHRHERRRGNHADALTLLAVLEFNLKQRGSPEEQRSVLLSERT